MAKETKVGLLAGLAFIVCFAIILANRGQPAASSAFEPGFVAEQRARQRQAQRAGEVPQGSRSHARGRGIGSAPPASPAAYQSLQRADQPPLQSWNDPGAPVSDQDAPFQQPVAPRGGAAPQSPPRDPARDNGEGPRLITDAVPAEPGDSAARGASLVAQSSEAAQRESLLADLLHRKSGTSPPASDIDASGDTRINPAKFAVGSSHKTYRVSAGDTLWGIVSRQYGVRSKRIVDAVLEANRGTLANANEIKTGMTLVLPTLAEHRAGEAPTSKQGVAPEAGAAAAPKSVEKTGGERKAEKPARGRDDAGHPRKTASISKDAGEKKSSGATGFRWYQVRKNDRFATIARSELGDAARWRELHELNRDRFPDPDKIREGVRIKIPADARASGETRR